MPAADTNREKTSVRATFSSLRVDRLACERAVWMMIPNLLSRHRPGNDDWWKCFIGLAMSQMKMFEKKCIMLTDFFFFLLCFLFAGNDRVWF